MANDSKVSTPMQGMTSRERADMRYSGAIRKSHKSIQSIELKMRKWFSNRPIFSNVFNISTEGTLAEKTLSVAVKGVIAAAVGTFVTNKFGMAISVEQVQTFANSYLSAKAATALAPHMWDAAYLGATSLASYKAYEWVSKYGFGAALLSATGKDAHKLMQKEGIVKARGWIKHNIDIISDAPFREPGTLLKMCKEIVEKVHAERSPEIRDAIGKTKQLDIWAADLALDIGQKARSMKDAGYHPNLTESVALALNDAPWAAQTVGKVTPINLATENPAAAGQFKFEYEFVDKSEFSPKPNLYDMDLFGAVDTPEYFSEERRTRLGALAARFEDAMLSNDTYKYLTESDFIGRSAALGILVAGASAAFTNSATGISAMPVAAAVTDLQSVGNWCAQHALVNMPTFLLRMVDRAHVVGMHATNRFALRSLNKLDYKDNLLESGYDALVQYVEERYNKYVASRMTAEHAVISPETIKINTDYYVAQTIAAAIDTKLTNRMLTLESLINDTIQETCLEAERRAQPAAAAPLTALARPDDAVFSMAPKLNLDALTTMGVLRPSSKPTASPTI